MKDIPVEIQLNQVTLQLKEHHNFDWLMKLGTVFAVFDQQDSGNPSARGLGLCLDTSLCRLQAQERRGR